jgi:hypothetical protein
MNEGLKTSLNKLRELSSELYHQYVPIIDDTTDIGAFANPILSVPEVYTEFCSGLVNRIVYTQLEVKSFRNPLKVLEGDRIPLGYAGQEVFINRAIGRRYNPDDFAGLLIKYEADVKVQYMALNMDVQYPVTFSRQQLKKAFVSWGDLETFIDGLSNSLYNGAYIDEFQFTKNIIGGAYKDNKAVIETITEPTDGDTAKAFVEKARELYLAFQLPSSNYNAWAKCGGAGRPIMTWTNPEDIVMIIKNTLRAKLDVEVLASAFNMDKTTLLGNIIVVDNFDVYDEEGTKVFDGSSIIGMIADKSWFRIKTQDMFMDSFYNPNNRSIQYYLNVVKMYNFSLFANGVIFATETPEDVPYESLSFGKDSESVAEGGTKTLTLTALPTRANADITYSSSNDLVMTALADSDDDRKVVITGVDEGTATLTATSGSGESAVTATISISVEAGE